MLQLLEHVLLLCCLVLVLLLMLLLMLPLLFLWCFDREVGLTLARIDFYRKVLAASVALGSIVRLLDREPFR